MTDPWGTPSIDTWGFDKELFITTDLVRFVKYVLNQFKAELKTPYLWHKRSRKTLWLMVSKAAE